MIRHIDLNPVEFYIVPADQDWSETIAVAGPCARGDALTISGWSGAGKCAVVIDGRVAVGATARPFKEGDTSAFGDSLEGSLVVD